MKFTLCLSLLLTGLLQVHCHHVPGHHEEQEHNGDQNPLDHQHHPLEEGQGTEMTSYKKIVKTNAEFAFRLYKIITSDPAPKNVFFSPLSISTAFAMLTLGAKAETHHQIFNGLGFNLSDIEENVIHGGFKQIIHTINQPSNVTQLNIGNALFIEKSLKVLPTFLNNLKTLYAAEGFSTNFKNSTSAENEINNYVKNKTNGKISQAVEELDESTVMIVLNYITFKGVWEEPFKPTSTRNQDFFVDANTTVKVNMMHRKGDYSYLYDEDLSCSVVRVPYNGDYSAWFILPDEGKLTDVEHTLTGEVMTKWGKSVRHGKIELHIPKFSISGSYDVKDLLQTQGVNDVFHDNADLSGITGQRDLRVSKAVHKAVMEVNEEGTEAAAVTTLEFVLKSGRIPRFPTFRYDRPFLIVINDDPTHNILFVAKVYNPAAK
ncbi:PREDICTED: alpha-1-antitrypsin-like [Gekko japonicus]|uniref:Alpha-1-antitrypsin-like n=1 Tax=Gekko japonicus TaxID=146911 RepID=A0ABM1KBB8_GEKJA|nr:PREDICTED: alpha-1-antitrypsin-like [Gekko japonicus]